MTTTDTGTSTGGTSTAEPAAKAKTRSVDATWEGAYRCRVQAGQFEIRVDEPASSGGDDTGPQPTELFLASFASCFALAVAHVARKRDIQLEDVAVRVTGTYDGPKFVNIRIEIRSSHPRPELDRLVERASHVCFVSNTMRAVNDTEVVIVDPTT
jgi:putative redox protein